MNSYRTYQFDRRFDKETCSDMKNSSSVFIIRKLPSLKLFYIVSNVAI